MVAIGWFFLMVLGIVVGVLGLALAIMGTGIITVEGEPLWLVPICLFVGFAIALVGGMMTSYASYHIGLG